jgi:hypothetical protein
MTLVYIARLTQSKLTGRRSADPCLGTEKSMRASSESNKDFKDRPAAAVSRCHAKNGTSTAVSIPR